MTLFAAFLICLAINITCEVELKCPNFVTCPCGNNGKTVSVCVPDSSADAEVCTRLSKCESCEEGSNTCSKCPEGSEGPFCTLYKETSATGLIFCRDPEIHANSFRRPSALPTCQGFSPGSRLDYSCDQGYDLNGEKSLFCLSSGMWTANLPRCVETPRKEVLIYCPDPGMNANSIRNPSTLPTLRGFIQGSYLEYSCDSGYKLSGVRNLFCQSTGKWTFNVPRCVNQSTTTVIDENQDQDVCEKHNKILCNDWGGGYKCMHFECPPDYLRDYDYKDMCRHAIKECPSRDLKCLGEPKVINYHCNTLSSNQNIPKSGQLELYFGVFLTSKKVKDEFALKVADVKAPTGVTPATGDNFQLRETADNRQVVSLTKSVQGPQEIELHLIPEALENMYCENPGLILNGRTQYFPPAKAMRNETGPNLDYDLDDIPEGGVLKYTCDEGYQLVGRRSLTCQSTGFWSAHLPTCVAAEALENMYCENPGLILNGRTQYFPPAKAMRNETGPNLDYDLDDIPEGGVLKYTCDEGYQLVGRRSLTCQSTGFWSAHLPTCVAAEALEITYCENPGLILNGRTQYFPPAKAMRSEPDLNLDYDLDEIPEGGVLKYTCDEGYRLLGRRSLTCHPTGFWSAHLPTCVADCGRSFPQMTDRFGKKTIGADWPWVVSISLDKKPPRFICAGALLNDHTVITAAHCVERNAQLLLHFGKQHYSFQDDDEEVITRRSSRIIVHPEYSNMTFDSDIGIITFHPKIRYSPRVQPICLPTRESTLRNLKPGRIGYVSGWGETELQLPAETIMMTTLPVATNQVCNDAYKPYMVLTGNMFCAGYDDARRSLCGGGHSGSPFVFYDRKAERFTLEGLTSFGKRTCGDSGNYVVFAKISRFVLWIIRNMQ